MVLVKYQVRYPYLYIDAANAAREHFAMTRYHRENHSRTEPGISRILRTMAHPIKELDDAGLCEQSRALIRDVLERIGDKWSVVVICQLGDTTRRFNELSRMSEPITKRMLSATLQGLERDGLVTRTVHDTKPLRVDYALTPRGISLLEVVRALAGWAEGHAAGILDSRTAFDTR
jgi:DNA-binding HxlR family transcriptional regulator